MTTPLLVDTDILVDFLRGVPAAVAFVRDNAHRVSLSAVVSAELYAGARESEIEALDAFLTAIPVLPVTPEIAREAGLLKRKYGGAHGLGLADAVIAATALIHGLELRTLNTRHYPMFPRLAPPYTKR